MELNQKLIRNYRRQEKRRLYERARRKKFLFLKHTGRMSDYLFIKRTGKTKKEFMKTLKEMISKRKSLWQRIISWIKSLFLKKVQLS
jgi:hypothetical protein